MQTLPMPTSGDLKFEDTLFCRTFPLNYPKLGFGDSWCDIKFSIWFACSDVVELEVESGNKLIRTEVTWGFILSIPFTFVLFWLYQ